MTYYIPLIDLRICCRNWRKGYAVIACDFPPARRFTTLPADFPQIHRGAA